MHEARASADSAFTDWAKSVSNCLDLGPVVSQPDLSVSTTSLISSSPITGLVNGSISWRLTNV